MIYTYINMLFLYAQLQGTLVCIIYIPACYSGIPKPVLDYTDNELLLSSAKSMHAGTSRDT